MLGKPQSFKVIVTSLVLFSSVSAFAETLTFKVAVIEGATATKEIVAGDLINSIEKLANKNMVKNTFENNTNLCVSYLQSNNNDKSESACTAAIKSIESMRLHNKEVRTSYKKIKYLKSLSYSNRGIARYLNNDFSGAIEDLMVATAINSNPITTNNLHLLRKLPDEVNEITSSLLAD